jgi:hypothetical protein
MTYELSQVIHHLPLAANEDAGWVQLLIFVIVAVMYALAGLARARSQKQRKQSSADEGPQRPTESVAPRQSVNLAAPAQHRPAIRSRTAFTTPASRQRPLRTPPSAKSAPEKRDLTDVRFSQPKPTSSKTTTPKAEPVSGSQRGAPALDVSDNAALRRAIIHYEVLGPCVGLRKEIEPRPSMLPKPEPLEPPAGGKK